MGDDYDLGAAFRELVDSRGEPVEAGRVGNLPIVHGHIEITTQDDAATVEIKVVYRLIYGSISTTLELQWDRLSL